MDKLWSAHFKGRLDEKADSFNSSLFFDKRLYKYDILGSVAHVTMLSECGVIKAADAALIKKGLSGIFYDIEDGRLIIENAEDIHSFIEGELIKRLGDNAEIGKKLHTARSRNDQVALDIRMYLRDSVDNICTLLKNLCFNLSTLAEENLDTVIPMYTHMQKAQPSTLAHYFMAYGEMFLRDIIRLKDCRTRINVMPLGAGALCATSYPIERARVAELLGFDSVTQNSLDAVSDRDFAVEYLSGLSIIMTHLSRFCEEIILWSTDEFGYITLPDAYSTGSSMMPQKKNPDMCELIRGKAGRVYGSLTALLTTLKGIPLAYNKDMQEDKEALFDAGDTVTGCLEVFTSMIGALIYNKERLYEGARGGYTQATDCADYLVKKGVPFREAHKIIGNLVVYCQDNSKFLDELNTDEFKAFSPLFDDDIKKTVKLENIIASRKITGGPNPNTVKGHIKKLKSQLEKV